MNGEGEVPVWALPWFWLLKLTLQQGAGQGDLEVAWGTWGSTVAFSELVGSLN
jgi:hypothetical protein